MTNDPIGSRPTGREGEVLHGGVIRQRLNWARDVEGRPDMLSWYQVPPGGACTRHRHRGKTETWLVVAGEGTVTIAGESFDARRGDVFVTRPGEDHALSNTGTEPLLFVNIVHFTGGPVETEELA